MGLVVNLVLRKWGERIIRHRQYAAGVALAAAFFSFFSMPFLGWISTIIIGLVALQNGVRSSLFVVAWAMLPAVALLYLGHYDIFINVVLVHYSIVWLCAIALHKKNSWVNLLQLNTLIGMGAVIVLYYFAPHLQEVFVAQLISLSKEYKSSFLSVKAADFDVWIKYISSFAMGLLTAGILIYNLVTLFIARSWQSLLNPAVNVQKEWHAIRLHYSASLMLLALIPGILLNFELFINLLVVASLPLAFSGLSLIHAYTSTKKNGSIFLLVFYMLMILFSPYLILLICLMGWLDSFMNFRKKMLLTEVIEE